MHVRALGLITRYDDWPIGIGPYTGGSLMDGHSATLEYDAKVSRTLVVWPPRSSWFGLSAGGYLFGGTSWRQ